MTGKLQLAGAVLVTAIVIHTACGESTTPTPNVVTVEVSPNTHTLTALGEAAQFTATARDAGGAAVSGKSFAWTSSATAVATVSTSGLATAVRNGSTTIRAAVDGVSGSAALEVAQAVASLELSGMPDTLKAIGAAAQLVATPRDAMGNEVAGREVTWTSSSAAVATVTAQGMLTAIGNGSATVTASSDGRTAAAEVVVLQTGSALVVTAEPSGAVAGEPLTSQPGLEIRDALGNLVAGDSVTAVTAAIAVGGGTLTGTAISSAVGGVIAFSDLSIEGTVGDRRLAFAAPGMIPDTSQAFALAAGPPTALVLHGGDGQSGLAGTTLAVPLAVKVSDAYTNGIAGVTVDWTVLQGAGSLAAASSQTDAEGLAQVGYTLGVHAGTDSVQANAGELSGSPLVLTVTATPNGTINGVVTLTDALVSPPAAVADATAAIPGPGLIRPSGADHKQMPLFTPSSTTAPRGAARQAEPEYMPDELIVTFKSDRLNAPPVGAAALASAATAQAVGQAIRREVEAYERSGHLALRGVSPVIMAARVNIGNPGQLDAVMAELRAHPAVAKVERNPIARVTRTADRPLLTPPPANPNDPFYPVQAWNYAMIDAPGAWDITTGSSSVLVAVVDDGIQFNHPGVAANLTTDGYDFVTNSYPLFVCAGGSVGNAGDGDGPDPDPTQPGVVVMDPILDCITGLSSSGNHGLHVAGTVGAVGNDGVGGTGVAWTVRIRPIRVLGIDGSGSNYDIAQGILYAAGLPADDGYGGVVQAPSAASIINLSVGGTSSTDLQNAVVAASASGSLLIASAGNDGTSAPMYPAAYSEVLSVSAVAPDGAVASYSNYGSTVDIAAPGGELAVGGMSFGIFSTAWDFTTGTPIWDSWQGTSMAAPHVSGVAALILAANPGLSAANLRARLVDYAVDVGPAGRDDYYGAGIVNARNSLTQSMSPNRDLYVHLYSALTGAHLGTTQALGGGSYEFTELDDGEYAVFAGQDEEGDGQTGIPVRRWGALGGAVSPGVVTVDGAGTYPASFDIGLPFEQEPNDDLAPTHFLPVGGYATGIVASSLADADVLTVPIPAAGTYTFRTHALRGACGFALEEDTILQLYDAHGTLVAENDNINAGALDFCSRISIGLEGGVYYLVVWGWEGARRYGVSVR